ncbi:MAG: MFS transporter [Gammaproteobacteria bacterium]|nr:MFS transporter [Gammaproteobacteria bacterium]
MTQRWQTPHTLLILMSIAMPIAFSTWTVLLNNFVVERASFTGVEIGILQSLREVPGFLAFTTVFVLLILKEQTFAVIALALLGAGVALAGFFPTAIGLYLTTVLMSTGFHYFEVLKQSLALQWYSKEEAPQAFGKLISVGAVTSLAVYAILWVMLAPLGIDYVWLFLLAGGICCALAVFMRIGFPEFGGEHKQKQTLVLKKRYWLFYALQFFSGARRQIFMVFAAFLMVEKFGYSAAQVTTLFLINYVFNWLFAERIGGLIGRIGERKALTIEYTGLIVVFTAYAFVENPYVGAALYVIDHMFFALAIAIKTYFQKIASPEDIASTAGVSFTINHIAAVVIPAALGLVWVVSHSAVFLVGTGFAICSLLLSQNIPARPVEGNEVVWGYVSR